MRAMFRDLRAKHDFPTRNPHKRPKKTRLTVRHRDGTTEKIEIPHAEFPVAAFGFLLQEAGILRGIEPSHQLEVLKFWVQPDAHFEKYHGIRVAEIRPGPFGRMVAKIAHSFCVANLGLDAFRPLLLDCILNDDGYPFHYVGGPGDAPAADNGGLHVMRLYCEKRNGIDYLMCEVRLFCCLGAPTYFVVVGEV